MLFEKPPESCVAEEGAVAGHLDELPLEPAAVELTQLDVPSTKVLAELVEVIELARKRSESAFRNCVPAD